MIVPRTGLVHHRDRTELDWPKRRGQGRHALLISSTYINRRTAGLAREIIRETRKDKMDEINLLIVLKGAVFFGCHLAQEIFRMSGPNVVLHFVSASSYGKSMRSSGSCRITGKLNMLRGRNVIVIDDICDTGLTLAELKQRLKKVGAKSVKTCILLDKPERRLARLKKTPLADFIGFQIPNVFVAGFGLEDAEKYRELPFIVAVKKRLIEQI